ncbi:MAG TPA: hypothetical protein VGN06_06070 [Gaiellaceae bacterium]|jgi:hypothetical protein
MVARVVIWNLADSKTTLDELREHLPELPNGSHWISNDIGERFGLFALGDELPDLGEIPALLGVDAVIFEEFDVE